LAIGLAELLLVAAMVYDYRIHGAVHRAYWAAACVFVAFHVAVTWAFGSPAWTDFATALTAG
jgi:hypothetical protein